ncbi:RloB family protein, partial [Corynebacterium felinum]
MARNVKPRRRGKAGSRDTKPSVMLVVQGELTERVYFERLKEILHLSNVSIKAVPHSPELIVSRSKQSINRDKNSPFTYVFYVIDVDESSDDQINRAVSEAKESKTKHTQHYVVVSYESFDSWLFAHHRRLCGVHFPRSHIQKELKKLAQIFHGVGLVVVGWGGVFVGLVGSPSPFDSWFLG